MQQFSSMKQKLICDVQQSYEFNLSQLDQKLKAMEEDTAELNKGNKADYAQLRQETLLIYETIRKYDTVLDNIQQGLYSGGKP